VKIKITLIMLAALVIPVAAGAFNSKSLIPDFLPNEQYTESWYFYFQFDEGYSVFSTIMVTNLGPGDRRPSFNCTIVSPGGKSKLYQGRHDSSDLTVSESPARLDMKTSYLATEGNNLHYHLDESGAVIDLLITPLLEGSAKMVLSKIGDDETNFYELAVPIALGKVTGIITVGGKKTSVSGRGYFEHSRSNITVLMHAQNAVRMLKWENNRTVSAIIIKPESGTRVTRAFCITAAGAKTQTNITLNETSAAPASKSWALNACNDTITLQALKLVQKVNLLDNLSFFEKAAMGLIIGNPVTERYQLKGGGFFESVVNE
jgi:hypothetical protein